MTEFEKMLKELTDMYKDIDVPEVIENEYDEDIYVVDSRYKEAYADSRYEY